MTDFYREIIETPVGKIEILSDGQSIFRLDLFKEVAGTLETNPNTITELAKIQLYEYFEGQRKSFDLPLSPQGTEYQKRIWRHLMDIPYGVTISYKALAIASGNHNASRAVGHANSKNTIMIVIPCHRVIGANGGLTGYAGGLDVKEWLITHEQKFANTSGL